MIFFFFVVCHVLRMHITKIGTMSLMGILSLVSDCLKALINYINFHTFIFLFLKILYHNPNWPASPF